MRKKILNFYRNNGIGYTVGDGIAVEMYQFDKSGKAFKKVKETSHLEGLTDIPIVIHDDLVLICHNLDSDTEEKIVELFQSL